ncbi:MAG: xylose isomerase [Verrucomicrobia bacterium]|nr:xylose isomerase [Verrucomicrobiota bacterium]
MKIVSAPPRLVMCAALWSLEKHPSAGREWSLGRKVAAIAAEGFDGICGYVSPELKTAAATHGLRLMSGFDCGDLATALPRLRAQRDLGVRFVNIQLLDHDTPPAVAAPLAVKLVRDGAALGLAVHIETHRDTATETPEKFDEIARRYRRATGRPMPVTWDHSHFAVSKHMLPPDYSARLLAWPELIQRSQMFHLRPFNSQHCQVPVTDGRGRLTPEFRDYLPFVEDLFALWLAGPRPGGELWVCPELGASVGYHVSTNPPVWPDAIRARREILVAWRRALARQA